MADWRTKEDLKAEIAFHEDKYIEDMESLLRRLKAEPDEDESMAYKFGWYKSQCEIARGMVEKHIEFAKETQTHGESDSEELLREMKEVI